jgi:hypothetical protein
MAISKENRMRFEGIGIADVRHELGVGYVKYLIGDDQRSQAVEWVAEQDARVEQQKREAKTRESHRFVAGLLVGAVGAFGTMIAAWPVIKQWLR